MNITIDEIAVKLCVEKWDFTDKHAVEILKKTVASNACISAYFNVDKKQVEAKVREINQDTIDDPDGEELARIALEKAKLVQAELNYQRLMTEKYIPAVMVVNVLSNALGVRKQRITTVECIEKAHSLFEEHKAKGIIDENNNFNIERFKNVG